MNELKPCPFCGCEEIKVHGKKRAYAYCERCFAKTDSFIKPQYAIDAWNQRAKEKTRLNGNSDEPNRK